MLKQAYLIYGRRRRSTSIFILMDLKRSTKIPYIVLTIIVQIGSGKRCEIGNFFPHNRTLKKMLEDVESEGFQFNPQNDTLLFHVYFCNWWIPCDLVVKTSAGISHYYQPPQEESFKIDSVMLAEDFFISSILYYGDNSAFTDFFRRYVILLPDSDGRYTLVFRIILKDGKIMTPSEVWKIADVYMWEGNYLTEEDIIFLKKLSRYYNKSDLNRLEHFSRTILLQ